MVSVGDSEPGHAEADNSAITVEVMVEGSSPELVEMTTEATGGDVIGEAPVVLVEIPRNRLDQLIDSIVVIGGVVRELVQVDIRPENFDAPATVRTHLDQRRLTPNALAWHGAGFTGKGVRIGVIDYFDVTKFWNTAEHGPLPIAGVTARCSGWASHARTTSSTVSTRVVRATAWRSSR